MKNCCIFFTLIFLLNGLQTSVGVQCSRATYDMATTKHINMGFVDCPSCAVYACASNDIFDKYGFPNKLVASGSGCPQLFYQDCAKYVKEIGFIKSKNENDMEYFNGNVQYVSGCGNEQNGNDCFLAKMDRFQKDVADKKEHGYKYGDDPIWDSAPTSGSNNQNSDSSNQNSDSNNQNSGPSNENAGIKNENSDSNYQNAALTDQNSALTIQNGAFKLIGFLAVGWILYAALI